MKVHKFRIKNFKSIVNSGDCYLTDSITILAGKNESGKTAILEALEDFSVERKIRDVSKPIFNKELVPEIEVTFNVSRNIIAEIANKAGSEYSLADEHVDISITKSYPDKYFLSEECIAALGLSGDTNEAERTQIEELAKRIFEIAGKYPGLTPSISKIDTGNISASLTQLTKLNEEVTGNIALIPEDAERSSLQNSISAIIKMFRNVQNRVNPIIPFVKLFMDSYAPRFILYSSFDDEFPHTIPIDQLDKNEWAQDLKTISNFKPEIIKAGAEREKRGHKEEIKVDLRGKFKKYWNQDPISLDVDWDNQKVYFWIEENQIYYEPKQRSKGQQWHLSFYLKVGARVGEERNNIILIDEPGLFLHAKAQKDILSILEDIGKDSQVIFSTHSPYLIEHEKSHRVKLVIKEKHTTNDIHKNTKIFEKIHAKADKETLTPILTAIGLGLNDGIQNIEKVKNVIVEGPSDVFYLQALKTFVETNDLNFIFGGGAGNMGFVGTILQGWGCKVIYLYDNDQGKKDGEKNLTKNWRVTNGSVLSVFDTGGTIEDVFSKQDFVRNVLSNSEGVEVKYETSNSEYVKKEKKDKVLLGKQFLERVSKTSVNFDKETLGNISTLFKKIEDIFDDALSTEKDE